jgi:4-hydroxythreonine-4-phosphate dehydrogenase
MKPLLAITVGDCNGIGPEIALKAATSSRVRRRCSLLMVGPERAFREVRESLRLPLRFLIAGEQAEREELLVSPPHVALFVSSEIGPEVYHPGVPIPEAGEAASLAIRAAVTLAMKGVVDGLVTAPTAKIVMQRAGVRFPGHTELLQHLTGAPDVAMMLVCRGLRVGLATIHEPLRAVPSLLSAELVLRKARLVLEALRNDWGIVRPRMAVLGLNPHAGESGMLGNEEQAFLVPALKRLQAEGEICEGPFPADAFFARYRPGAWDAVLAMYHDQGLIPLKMTARGRGVNVTAGLPIIRTSPDHGTAFDIAGKSAADPSSMEEAILLAATLAVNRRTSERRRAQ